jgi:hypothetical protein
MVVVVGDPGVGVGAATGGNEAGDGPAGSFDL